MKFWSRLMAANSAMSFGRNGGSAARRRVETALLLLLILNGALLFLLFRPPGRSLVERQEEFERNRARHESARQAVEQMRELQSKLQGAIQNGWQFSRQAFLARRAAFSTMLADLERLASQSRLRNAGVGYQLDDEPNPQGLVNVEITLSVEGEYPDLVQFINRLEQSELFWIVKSMNVSGSSGRALRLDLQMETYLVPS